MCNGSVTSPRSHNLTLGEVGFKPSLAPKRHSYSLHFAASNTTCVPLLGFSGLPLYLVYASILALVTFYSRIKWPPSPTRQTFSRAKTGPISSLCLKAEHSAWYCAGADAHELCRNRAGSRKGGAEVPNWLIKDLWNR